MLRLRTSSSHTSDGGRVAFTTVMDHANVAWRRAAARRGVGLPAMLLFAGLALGIAAWSRGPEYDEGYTRFLSAGTPRPAWPEGTFTAGDARSFYAGHSSAASLARDLRQTDVHPPLYFWSVAAWRGLFGTDLLTTRLFSVLCALASLALVARIARLTAIPPLSAMALTLGCYGFAYTSVIARGFALAQTLTLAGVTLVILAARAGRPPRAAAAAALGAGIACGLATFTNYLAAFAGAAALLWLLLRRWRHPSVWIAAAGGYAAVLPAVLWFFLAQRDSRTGQFPPFELMPSIARLAQYAAGALFGGLPLYVPTGPARLAVGTGLALLLAALPAAVAWHWRAVATPGTRWLLAMAAVASPLGLLALGLVFDNTPIELRYLSFSIPFVALLLAGALGSLSDRWRVAALGLVAAVQGAAIIGLMAAGPTMQPQGQAARDAAALAEGGVALVPYGNDGVGVLGAFVAAAPDTQRILAVRPDASPENLHRALTGTTRVVVVALELDRDSRAAVSAMRAAFETRTCWRRLGDRGAASVYGRVADCSGE